jgi:hypothetical protein
MPRLKVRSLDNAPVGLSRRLSPRGAATEDDMIELFFAYLAGLFTIPSGLVLLLLIALVKEAWGERR